jgi:hypothetical protein
VRFIVVIGLVAVCLLSWPASAAAEGNDDGKGKGKQGLDNPPALSATPELDSLALFGAGVAGMAGYALTRVRARRRQDKRPD